MNNTILLQRGGAIATVVLNNPGKLNALSAAMWMRLGSSCANSKRKRCPRPFSTEERDEDDACFDSEDCRTGFKAFLAKQKPQFKGR